MQEYDVEEYQMEVENRIKNLMWTVSGDYDLDVKPDVASFAKNKYISLYDAIKQGAFAKYYSSNELAMYIVKKMYYGAEEPQLMSIAQMCVDAAAYPKISRERPGVEEIRRKAFDAMLDIDFRKMSESYLGRVKMAMIRSFLYKEEQFEQRVADVLYKILSLGNAGDTMDIIKVIDEIYNTAVDQSFERKHGNLEQVLAVELEELASASWQDFLDEEMYESVLEQFVDEVNRKVTSLEDIQEKEEEKSKTGTKKSIVVLDQAALDKMNSYMQLNFGRSYLSETEQKRINYRLCKGAHADCSLYYTDGILNNPVLANAQYVNAKKQADRNRLLLHNNKSMVKRNIEILTANLQRSLVLRTQQDEIPSDYGTIVPFRLWKIGRADTDRMFTRIVRQNHSDFVVDILMDASGSQRDRQSQVALQAYIISEALSNVNIPHRVMSFCTFWDYTVMQRFREYDAPKSENRKILEYTTSSNNRDGLAIRAAADALICREEENKILIVLSDGRPNDVVVNRPNSKNPKPYCGEYAVTDTALEVRKLRNEGVFVLGVFTGKEKDLAAEKKIFGKDFAYIKNVNNFATVVGLYLQKLLDW
ncbi:MAG: nitric oxide reductase activation protein [Muricoprocola sp.]